jgi:tripartite-type tricarboxylate transporter receptor subunit TctC
VARSTAIAGEDAVKINRRRFLATSSALIGTLAAGHVSAYDYPNRPIRFVVPFTPGAGTDRTARILAEKLGPMLGQPIVVENRGGASGAIGTDFVSKAAPDGYTWVLGHDPAFTINQHLRKMPYDALRDFVPVALITHVPLVLVANPKLKANSIQELVRMAQADPGKLTISSSGNGTSGHLAAEVFMFATDTKLLHVPYKGQAEAVTDVLAGRIDLNFTAIADILSLARSNKLKVLAIGAPQRFEGLPDVPTVAECGYPNFDVSAFHGLLMPAGTPAAIVSRINGEVNRVLATPDVKQTFENLGLFPVGGEPDRLAHLLKSDSDRWAGVIREANIRVE